MGISQKVQAYLTAADRTITIAGTTLIALESVYGQVPIIGIGVASLGIGLSVVKYIEKTTSDPTTLSFISDLQSRIAALEDYIKTNKATAVSINPVQTNTADPTVPAPTPSA